MHWVSSGETTAVVVKKMQCPVNELFSLCKTKAVKLSCQSSISEPEVFWGVSYHCLLSLMISKREMKSTKKPHSRQSCLTVSALVLGSLVCSGLSGKLFHQTRVSSTGCMAVWLLQGCPATLQKTHSQPLWRALMKSMAWALLLLILLVRSHTWLSKGKLNHR